MSENDTVVSDDGKFEWSDAKDVLNIQNHGFSFSEILEVFDDPYLLTKYDEKHSDAEDRFISVGRVKGFVIVVVVHTERNGIIRVVSARKALKRERGIYYERIRRLYSKM